MSSQASREEERRLSIGTLAIASIASATAALITSQFWQGGTPIAAAVTPVIVTLVSELLHRPTAKIAERMTVDRAALPADAAEPLPEETRRTLPLEAAAAEQPPAERSAGRAKPEVRVYRSQSGRHSRLSLKLVAITAGMAFVIGVAVLTLPELIAGQSLGRSDRGTTIFSGKKRSSDQKRGQEDRREAPAPATEPSEQPPEPPETTQPDSAPEKTTPEAVIEPETTEPAPQPKKAPPQTTPESEPPQTPNTEKPAP